jgi:outer membrane protein assembly factor BamB
LEKELVKALDAKDGKKLWATTLGKVGNPTQQPNYPAARSTPTVDGEVIYALGSDGDLAALEKSSGKILWSKSLRSEFGGKPGNWAYAESPLVDGDKVICMPGGREATIIALEKKTGKVLWKTVVPGAESANFSSMIVAEPGGKKQYVGLTGGGLVGLDPNSGKQLWLYEKTKSKIGSIPTPVAQGRLIYSASNRVGGGTVRVEEEGAAWKATELYFDPKLPTAIGGFVVVGDYLYGCGTQTLLCADLKTGEIKWSERSAAPGSLCYADGRLYLHSESGVMVLVEATPEAYREHGRLTPSNAPGAANQMEKTWAYPVIADGRLYLRNKDSLWAYQLK